MPHYVTWNPIKTEKPDFHQPSYFGLLKFKWMQTSLLRQPMLIYMNN
jgi:hypothetical protein